MGFLSNCNFFTESDFNDYRRLDKILNEADKDDDLNDDESESNFDMPDDEDDNTNQQTQDNPPESSPTNQQDTGDAGDDDLNDDESESNFDMPDDEDQGANNEPAPQSMDGGNTAAQSDPAPDTATQDAGDGGDDESESNFDLPDDDGDQQQGDQQDGVGDNGSDDLGDDESESNFDMDDGDGTDGDTGDTGVDGMSTGEDPDQDLKDAENDIFNGLSDQDKVIKINELKDLYQDLYNRIITLYDKVNDIPKDDELIKVYNFIIDNLSDLKQFVYDYLTNTFDNKTYLENMVNYKKYLSTLNVINGILEEIRKGLYKESGN